MIHVYDNGLQLDATTGQIVRPPRGGSFTPETSRLAHSKRQEKAAAELRARIRAVAQTRLEPVRSSAEAFAESGALLFDEVVLNPDAYPRDRLETWEKLGKYAKVLPADTRDERKDIEDAARVAALQAATAHANVETAQMMVRVLNDVMKVQRGEKIVVDGKVIE